jgi:hypothetical protein
MYIPDITIPVLRRIIVWEMQEIAGKIGIKMFGGSVNYSGSKTIPALMILIFG